MIRAHAILVFNGLGWGRMALASVPGLDAESLVDLESGRSVAVQVVDREGQRVGCFVPPEVPSIGYRVLAIEPSGVCRASASKMVSSESPWKVSDTGWRVLSTPCRSAH